MLNIWFKSIYSYILFSSVPEGGTLFKKPAAMQEGCWSFLFLYTLLASVFF
uniref:Uncharacterized protein n=1 Tax=Anguilla anguilla TaxID=7936 RepID=A0A0E9WEF9_ANGAN